MKSSCCFQNFRKAIPISRRPQSQDRSSERWEHSRRPRKVPAVTAKRAKKKGQKGGREERKGSGSETGGCAVQRKCQAKRESFFWGEHRLVVLIYSLRISVYGEDKLKAEQRNMQISGRKMLSSDQAFDAAVEDLQKTQEKSKKKRRTGAARGGSRLQSPFPARRAKIRVTVEVQHRIRREKKGSVPGKRRRRKNRLQSHLWTKPLRRAEAEKNRKS